LRLREYSTPAVALILLLAGIVLFGPSVFHPFHFDDSQILVDANVTNAAQWSHFFNPLHLRQFTYFTFYLNHRAGGTDPRGYHAVNVLIHIANAILLFLLLKRFVTPETAAVAAAIFLVHPIQTEPVFYVYQRATLLACLFSLLALFAFQARRYWLAIPLFFLAFESKESALAVPLALGLLSEHRFRKWLAAGAIACGGAALAILTYRSETTVGIGAIEKVTPWSYFGGELRVIYTYLRLLFLPYPQSLEYDFPKFQLSWLTFAQAAGLLAIVVIGIWAARQERWKPAGLAVLAFFVLLAPTSSFIPNVDAAFEHRLYLPMLAFSFWAAWMLSLLRNRTRPTVIVLGLLALLTVNRSQIWASDVALWQDAVSNAPGKARAWLNLGSAQVPTDPRSARLSLRKAIDLDPTSPHAYINLGVVEQNSGNLPQAILYFREAIRVDGRNWIAWYNAGRALLELREYDRAISSFERVLKLNRDYYPAHYQIAATHLAAGRPAEAIPHLRTVLDWDPTDEVRRMLADAEAKAAQPK
jgi:tetratricopeptide (TPR) repeat protein